MRVTELRLAPAPPVAGLTALCAAIVLTAFTRAPLLGQTLVGQISGLVRDDSGGVVPGVAVVAINDDTGASGETVTDGGGFYVVTNLGVGPYR